MKYEKIAQKMQLKNGEKEKISLEGKEILLVNIQDTFYAVDNKCPHMGGSLVKGKLDGTNIVCPKHGSTFDVRTGKVTQKGKILFINVKAEDLKVYPVKIEGEDILVGIE